MQTLLAPIIAVAAGSAGHILPSITIAHSYADQLQRPVWLITGTSQLDATAIENLGLANVERKHIENVPYAKPWRLLTFLYQMLVVFFDCLSSFKQHKPIKIISTGGYLSIPVFLAAKVRSIPTELWSLDVEPGRTVKLLQYIADDLIVCFPQSIAKLNRPAQIKPYPVRFSSKDIIDAQTARTQLQLDPHKKTIMVLGGSKGSRFFNAMLSELITHYHDQLADYQFIHQTGFADEDKLRTLYDSYALPAYVFSYSHHMPVLLSAADTVICRSGAGSLAETLFFGKSVITIPLEAKTTCHQVENAYATQQIRPDRVIVLREQEATPARLIQYFK